MSSNEQAKLKFNGVDIINVSFKSTQQFDQSVEVKLDITPKVLLNKKDPKSFKILMTASLIAEKFFELEVIGFGSFNLSEDINDRLRKQFINSNAVAIVFPYLRSFITSFTSSLGNVTGRLLIPTQFFQGELEDLEIPENPEDVKLEG